LTGHVLQFGARQVHARVVCRHDRDAAPHAAEAVGVAHVALRARLAQRGAVVAPAVQREQAAGLVVQCLRQVVFGLDAQLGDDEFAFARRMGVQLWVAHDAVPLAHAHIAFAAFALELLGLIFVALDPCQAQAAVVGGVVADVRRVDEVVVQAGREAVAQLALVVEAGFLGRGRAGRDVVPALAADAPRRQRAHRVPGRDDVARLGRMVAVEAHLAAGIFLQRRGVVEQDQRVQGCLVVAALGGRAGLDEPCQAAPLPQAAQEGARRLVVLHGEFACRIGLEVAEVVGEGARGHRVGLAEFLEQDRRDVDFAGVAEHARIARLVEQAERVAHDELVRGQAAIALAFGRRGDDAAHGAQAAAVGDKLQFDGVGDELFQFEAGLLGDAQQRVVDAAADALDAADVLHEQQVVAYAVTGRDAQANGTIGVGQT
jgi:hypothetical protein